MSGCFTVILHAHQNHAVTHRIKLLPQIGRLLGLADSEFNSQVAIQSLMMRGATVVSTIIISVESPTSACLEHLRHCTIHHDGKRPAAPAGKTAAPDSDWFGNAFLAQYLLVVMLVICITV
jgi:hypothetical protein